MKKKQLLTAYPKHHTAGFTLLEMLVVIVIFMILTSGTVVTYSNFLYRQQALQSAKNVQEAMRTAQKKARSGDKPTGCVTLQGYRVSGGTSSTVVTIHAICRNGANTVTYQDSTVPLISDTRLEESLSVTFSVITGGVIGADEVQLNSHNLIYSFTVNSGGNISEGAFE